MKVRLSFCLFMTVLSVNAAYDMSRYEVIMERSPFGKEPPPDDLAAPAKPSGEFAKQYRLCMLYQNADGQLKAGLVSKTSNKSFFLAIGETDDGLTITDVDIANGTALLKKDGEVAQLVLEGLNLPVVAAVASGSGLSENRVAAGAESRSLETKKSYSFLQPVIPSPRQQQVVSAQQSRGGYPGGSYLPSGSDSGVEQDGSSAGHNSSTGSNPLASTDEKLADEPAYKRIIVTSSKRMPGKFAFIPR